MVSDLFVDSTSQLTRSGRIKTSSRLRKFWLGLRGYTVEKRLRTPKGYTLGRLTYQTSWVLKPKSRD